MYPSARYPTDLDEAERWVATMRHATLIATAPGRPPEASILPFVKEGDLIELHCVQEDPTFGALQENPLASLLVSDFLAFTPHHWVDPQDGGRGTLNFRAVLYRCRAELSTEPGDVAAALRRLLAAYEPGASYEPIQDGRYYGQRLRRLAAVRLTVLDRQAKFKVGPAGVDRAMMAGRLRERGWPGDERAAAEIGGGPAER